MTKYFKFLFVIVVLYYIISLFNNSVDSFEWTTTWKITFAITTFITYFDIIVASDESA